MRISDWSSDVCSSDLPSIFTKSGIMVGLGEGREEVHQVMDDLVGRRRLHDHRPVSAAHAEACQGRSFRHAGEIGSASCRERGCQYWSISVVAVALKKTES